MLKPSSYLQIGPIDALGLLKKAPDYYLNSHVKKRNYKYRISNWESELKIELIFRFVTPKRVQ